MEEHNSQAGTPPFDAAHRDEIRTCVDAIAASAAFASSPRRAQLLRYLVERTLTGEGDQVNEYAIGQDVFERPPSFDPRIESIVRTEMGRLRQKLKEYYSSEGQASRCIIALPLRSYCPTFTIPEQETTPAPAPSPAVPILPAPRPRRVAMLAAVLTLAAAIGGFSFWKLSGPPKGPLHSLVVLPFQDQSPTHDTEYLADGMTDELTNDFAVWKDLRVVARTSAYQYKGKGVDVRKIGRELNVDAILEGSLSKQGDRLRITAQLNRTSDGYHLWSHSYEVRSQDMMTVQTEIAQSIASTVTRLNGNTVGPVARARTRNPEAQDLLLRANHLLQTQISVKGYKEAVSLLEQAVQKDPGYSAAYVQMADVDNALLQSAAYTPEEGNKRLRQEIEQAIAADPGNPEAHGWRAALIYSQDWDWPRADAEYKLAIEKGAGMTTRSLYGWGLMTQGRYAEAEAQLRTAQDMNPFIGGPRLNEGNSLLMQRRFPEAKRILKRLEEDFPGTAVRMLTMIAAIERDCGTVQSFKDWTKKTATGQYTKVGDAMVSECHGEHEKARRGMTAEAVAHTETADSFTWARYFAYVHNTDAAIASLTRAMTDKESAVLVIKHDPFFDGLRQDPRFIAIEKTVGLEP